MKSINGPFNPAALADEELPDYFRESSPARTEDDEWISIQQQFEAMCGQIDGCELETKAQALEQTHLKNDPAMGEDFKYLPEHMVPFRETDDAAMLEEQLQTVRWLIPKVRAGIKARKLTFDFIRDWGWLSHASGYVMCTWCARGPGDLASERGWRRSVAKRSKDKHKRAVARLMLPLLGPGMKRAHADWRVGQTIDAEIVANRPLPGLSLSETKELLDEEGNLEAVYCEKRLSKPAMVRLLADERKIRPPEALTGS